ncbi:MAG: hypothetical protein ACRDUY_14800, partial [Nitriliruptorales bacterium]
LAQAVEGHGASLSGVESRATPETEEDRRELSARAVLERETLRVALQRPDLLPERWAEVEEDDFVHPKARAVHRALAKAGGPGAELALVVDVAEDDEVRSLVRAIAIEDFTVEPDPPHVAMLVARVLLHRIEKEIAGRKSELERVNPTVDPDGHRTRFQELIALEAQRRDLREEASG